MMITLMSLLVMQPAADAPSAEADQELVCKRVKEEARRTGSNLRRPDRSKKVCRTAIEWAQIEQSKEEFFRGVNENEGGAAADRPGSFGG